MRISLFPILLLLGLSTVLGGQGEETAKSEPDPYAAAYFAGWGAVRAFLDSDMAVTGTIRLNADSTASEAEGTIVVNDLLYGKADGVPKSVPFEREVDFGASFIESHADAQTDEIRIDNPDALSKPFDSRLAPFSEGVRKALLERKSVSSLATFGGETLLGWFMRDVNPAFDEVHPYPERQYLPYLREDEMSAYEKHQIDQIRPGMSFQDLRGFMCENGGLTASGEYYVAHNMRAVAVRIAFRPAGMPEAAFHDPAQRVLWLKQHPDLSPSDAVVESHSKPFLTSVWFD